MKHLTRFLLMLLLAAAFAATGRATVYTVTTEAGSGDGSLPDMAARLSMDGDTLTFADSVRTVRLTSYLRIESVKNNSYVIKGNGVTIFSTKNVEFGFGTAKRLGALTIEDLHFNTRSYVTFAVAGLSATNCAFVSEDGVKSEVRLEAARLDAHNAFTFSGCAFIGRGTGQRRISVEIMGGAQQTTQLATFVSCTFINGEHSAAMGNVFYTRPIAAGAPANGTLALANCVIVDRKGPLSINMPAVISHGYNVLHCYADSAGNTAAPAWLDPSDAYLQPGDSAEVVKAEGDAYHVVYDGGNGKAYRRLRAHPANLLPHLPFPVADLSGRPVDYSRPTHSGAWQQVFLKAGEAEAAVAATAFGITLSPDREIFTEQSFRAVAMVQPASAAQDVAWSSGDTTIAVVDSSGLVTVLPATYDRDTTAVITATTTAARDSAGRFLSSSLALAVRPFVHATGVDIDGQSLDGHFFPGYERRIAATVLPTNANNPSLTWTVEPQGIVEIVNFSRDKSEVLTIKAISPGAAVITAASLDNGLTASLTVKVSEADYTSGMFLVNEDWFGHDNGSVNYLHPGGSWDLRVLAAVNGRGVLGVTTQFGAIYGGRFYLVSKQNTRLSIVDARTLRLIKSFSGAGIGEALSFIGADERTGYLAASGGIRVIDLDAASRPDAPPLSSFPCVSGGGVPTGVMEKAGPYVFAILDGAGALAINAATHTAEQLLSLYKYHSLTLAPDGYVYAGVKGNASPAGNPGDMNEEANSVIVRIDPWTLEEKAIALPAGHAGPPSRQGAWQRPPVCAGATENVLYWKSGNGIVCYRIDDNSITPVLDLSKYKRHPDPDADPYTLYGTAFGVQPGTDTIYAVAGTFASLGGNVAHRNHWKVLKVNPKGGQPLSGADGEIGNIVAEYALPDHYWFPAMPVFPDRHRPTLASSPLPSINLDPAHTADSLCIRTMVHDADNIPPSVTATIVDGYNQSLIGARIWRDTLIVSSRRRIAEGSPSEHTVIRLKFNSNGHAVTVDLPVTVHPPSAVATVPVDTALPPKPLPPPSPSVDPQDVTVDNISENEARLYFPSEASADYCLVHLYRRSDLVLRHVFTLKVSPTGAVTLRSLAGGGFSVPLTYLHSGASYFVDIEFISEASSPPSVLRRQSVAFTTRGVATSSSAVPSPSPQVAWLDGRLRLSGLGGYHASLYDTAGRLLASFPVEAAEEYRPLRLGRGVYVVVARKGSRSVALKAHVRE